jgi:hypothetical protein
LGLTLERVAARIAASAEDFGGGRRRGVGSLCGLFPHNERTKSNDKTTPTQIRLRTRLQHLPWPGEPVGQLTPPALVGEGRGQRVDLELGRAQLKLRLDTDQRFINGLNTKLDDPKPAVPEDRLGKELVEFFDAAIPGLAKRLAGRLNVSESAAYLIGEEWFDALQAVHSTVGES